MHERSEFVFLLLIDWMMIATKHDRIGYNTIICEKEKAEKEIPGGLQLTLPTFFLFSIFIDHQFSVQTARGPLRRFPGALLAAAHIVVDVCKRS